MEDQSPMHKNPVKGGRGADPRSKASRKPKQGNSEVFNEILSAANTLSVTERLRLVKSLAGQLSMVVIGSGEILQKGETPKQKGASGPQAQRAPVRPNPLRSTIFERNKDEAYKALVEAKRVNQGAKLPADHVAVQRYAEALAAYKAEHNRLAPVEGQTNNYPPVREKKKAMARTTTDRSPEPAARESRSIVGQLRNSVAKAMKSGKSISSKDMEDESIL